MGNNSGSRLIRVYGLHFPAEKSYYEEIIAGIGLVTTGMVRVKPIWKTVNILLQLALSSSSALCWLCGPTAYESWTLNADT